MYVYSSDVNVYLMAEAHALQLVTVDIELNIHDNESIVIAGYCGCNTFVQDVLESLKG